MRFSSTASAIALATAAWAGPKILLASSIFETVTFGITKLTGLVIKFGLIHARSPPWPIEGLLRALAKDIPTGPSLEPMIRSIWANELPEPRSASPIK